MKAVLEYTLNLKGTHHISVTGSKSESNRLLLLQALYPGLIVENISKSDDSVVLAKGLQVEHGTVDIHHAGTAMRFLTAYFASQQGKEVILTGSARMQERPIGILVDALRELGAHIEYEKTEGYPPLKIIGKELLKETVAVKANISSQFISALMLIAPFLEKGLKIHLEGKVTSTPYIEMTLNLLRQLGIDGSFSENLIAISPLKKAEIVQAKKLTVESDWSSASYFYSIVALSQDASITIDSYKQDSLQGDSALSDLYTHLGVKTEFSEATNSLKLTKGPSTNDPISFDLSNTPDIAQTIAVTCFGLGKGCFLTGLHTLKIKETDRLEALKVELQKLGGQVEITEDSLRLFPSIKISEGIEIDTYHDHRMAMAFAPLALKTDLQINDCMVVTKSFPTYWEDLKALGFKLSLLEK